MEALLLCCLSARPLVAVLQAYHTLYKENIPVAQLVRETAAVMQEFTRELLLGLRKRSQRGGA